MRTSNQPFANSDFIKLKDSSWLERQRVAGSVTSKTLQLLQSLVKEKTTKSLKELNVIAEEFILANKCIPTFKGYHGFPAGVCISVNEQIVHGIPSDRHLQEGDVVSFDLGSTFEGVIADSALTCIFGQPRSERHIQLVGACEESLALAIKSIRIGSRLGVIGNNIYRHGKNKGFTVITDFGGHGIDMDAKGNGIPHASPFVCNRADFNEGIRIQEGLTIAIEPLLTLAPTTDTAKDSDGWTICCKDISAHNEHTIFVRKDGVEVLTWREDERYLPTNFIPFGAKT